MPETTNVNNDRLSADISRDSVAAVPPHPHLTEKDVQRTLPQLHKPPIPLSIKTTTRALPPTPTKSSTPRALPPTPAPVLPAYGKGSLIRNHPAFVKKSSEECAKELAGATEGCFLINPRKEGGYWLHMAASDPKKPGSTQVYTLPLERVDKIYRLKSKEKTTISEGADLNRLIQLVGEKKWKIKTGQVATYLHLLPKVKKKDSQGQERIIWGNWRDLTHVTGRNPHKSASVRNISPQEISKQLGRVTAESLAKKPRVAMAVLAPQLSSAPVDRSKLPATMSPVQKNRFQRIVSFVEKGIHGLSSKRLSKIEERRQEILRNRAAAAVKVEKHVGKETGELSDTRRKKIEERRREILQNKAAGSTKTAPKAAAVKDVRSAEQIKGENKGFETQLKTLYELFFTLDKIYDTAKSSADNLSHFNKFLVQNGEKPDSNITFIIANFQQLQANLEEFQSQNHASSKILREMISACGGRLAENGKDIIDFDASRLTEKQKEVFLKENIAVFKSFMKEFPKFNANLQTVINTQPMMLDVMKKYSAPESKKANFYTEGALSSLSSGMSHASAVFQRLDSMNPIKFVQMPLKIPLLMEESSKFVRIMDKSKDHRPALVSQFETFSTLCSSIKSAMEQAAQKTNLGMKQEAFSGYAKAFEDASLKQKLKAAKDLIIFYISNKTKLVVPGEDIKNSEAIGNIDYKNKTLLDVIDYLKSHLSISKEGVRNHSEHDILIEHLDWLLKIQDESNKLLEGISKAELGLKVFEIVPKIQSEFKSPITEADRKNSAVFGEKYGTYSSAFMDKVWKELGKKNRTAAEIQFVDGLVDLIINPKSKPSRITEAKASCEAYLAEHQSKKLELEAFLESNVPAIKAAVNALYKFQRKEFDRAYDEFKKATGNIQNAKTLDEKLKLIQIARENQSKCSDLYKKMGICSSALSIVGNQKDFEESLMVYKNHFQQMTLVLVSLISRTYPLRLTEGEQKLEELLSRSGLALKTKDIAHASAILASQIQLIKEFEQIKYSVYGDEESKASGDLFTWKEQSEHLKQPTFKTAKDAAFNALDQHQKALQSFRIRIDSLKNSVEGGAKEKKAA